MSDIETTRGHADTLVGIIMKHQRAHNLCFSLKKTTGKLSAFIQFGEYVCEVKFTHLKMLLITMKKSTVLMDYDEAGNTIIVSMPA